MTWGTKTITIVQGDYAVSTDPEAVMTTVLGSCVAVCLFDPRNAVGGMNHFLLATVAEGQSDDLKYGVNAMELLINRMLGAGAQRANLQAKLFGGARMTDHSGGIGTKNAAFAQEFLEKEGIPEVSSSLGGDKARRVQFIPTTGAARQMQVAGDMPDETRIARPVRQAPDITLF